MVQQPSASGVNADNGTSFRSMLMKTSAHALRLAGALHVAHSLELRDAASERIF